MSVYATNRSVPLGAITTHRVVAWAERTIEDFVAWRNARATAATLQQLSDSQLADIGLHRGEIPEIGRDLSRF